MPILPLGCVVASVAVMATAGAWVLERSKGRRVAVPALAVVYAGIVLVPLAMPAGHPFVRFLAGVVALAGVVKLTDAAVDAFHGRRKWEGAGRWAEPSVRGFVAFLPNLLVMVRRKAWQAPRPSRRSDLVTLGWSLVAFTAGLLACTVIFRARWSDWPFLAEHTVKVIALYAAIIPASAAIPAFCRLFLGWPALAVMDNPVAATTPADFWRRYNRLVGQFFLENVFKPAGGLRNPVLGTLAVFVVSAAAHEYVFAVALGRVEGYQTAFFLTQGVASALTFRVRPRGKLAVTVALAVTLAFNMVTSTLFFASWDGVFPFYDRSRTQAGVGLRGPKPMTVALYTMAE